MSVRSEKVTNFMNGVSFTVNPLLKLKFIAASSFFGEPSYYRTSDERGDIKNSEKGKSSKNSCPDWVKKYFAFSEQSSLDETTVDIFIKAIDDALTFDFQGTLELAKELRKEYNMRKNPNIIFVRAALHCNRQSFNASHPKIMRQIGVSVASRPDDLTTQFLYYLSLNGKKNNLPGILKRVWSDRLSSLSVYELKKYLTTGKLIDLVRVSHANSNHINEMMKTGDLKTSDNEKTWETLRASGKKWSEIVAQINIPHMALLRNLRGMSEELSDDEMKSMCTRLVDGVPYGKQFPYRYYSAYNEVKDTNIKETLNQCIDKAMVNFPKLKGKTISLCDNSGSAHGICNSSYGSTTVSTIANLSGVMTAVNSDSGQVGVFGDELILIDIDPEQGILTQLKSVENKGQQVGGGTENGIWLFFQKAISENLLYDNIFIYSDQQAGHGGLYGKNSNEYKEYLIDENRNSYSNDYIDVLKLVETYRNKVNPKVNIFSVQVAGYDNNVLPEILYRGALLSGWTGNEVVYAKYLIDLWNTTEQN